MTPPRRIPGCDRLTYQGVILTLVALVFGVYLAFFFMEGLTYSTRLQALEAWSLEHDILVFQAAHTSTLPLYLQTLTP